MTLAYDRRAAVEIEEEDVGELDIADYLVFLFALDTYMRWVEEVQDLPMEQIPEGNIDAITRRGLMLLRSADSRVFDALERLLRENLTNKGSLRMLDAVMRTPPTARGAGIRALRLRTILSRGGSTTARAVFGTSPRARKEVLDAIGAAMMEDADAALNKFAAITLRNKRLEKWIDLASETVPPRTVTTNPIEQAAKNTQDYKEALVTSRAIQEGSPAASDAAAVEGIRQSDVLRNVEADAQEAAQRAMVKSGDEDRPLTRSEVIAVATTTAVAAAATNVPPSLTALDPEQRAAAMTDGRVLVAAGAGAGKSTTLIARVKHLVLERQVSPSRVFVTSFNAKASNELKFKISKGIGEDNFKSMSVGTMHSLFRRFINEYGTKAEVASMTQGFVQGGAVVAGAVNRAWKQCYPNDDQPKLKDMMRYKSIWAGNGISPAEAKAKARGAKEIQAAKWYEFYEGFKGSIPGWRPPCASSPKDYETFMSRRRPGGVRLGDFDDMLGIFRDVLTREPGVRKSIQQMFDHVLVDECQDLNQVQNDIIMMMTEHIGDGSDGRSLWMVGDDKQSIYAFRGARPDLFTSLDGKPGWKTRMIRTNYRCQPEIVTAANRLIAHNADQIPMEANPDSRKARGAASIRVATPIDEASAALSTVREIKQDMQSGGDVTDNAVLTRTNREQHAFETACIIKGIPYARKGASSFFGSPETTTVLSYVQLATGDDCEKMQASLKMIINKPNRFFVAPEVGSKAVEEALSAYARRTGTDIKSVNPVGALSDPQVQRDLAVKLAGSGYGFKYDKTVEKIREMAEALSEMRTNTDNPEYKMRDLFKDILSQSGTTGVTDPRTGKTQWIEQTLRQSLQVDLKNAMGDDDDSEEDEDEDPETMGLGNVGFLFELAQVDPDDPDDALTDPSTPMGFRAKMERYAGRMRDLRVDVNKWDKEQEALPPDQRRPPPGVYLGTVHSVKGAQWKNVYVSMPRGKFPFEPRIKPGEEPPPPEELAEQREQERRLAYVAITRPIQNLTVICPSVVGGKAAGVSPFVDEAGLHVGENVDRPGAPANKEASVAHWHLPRGSAEASHYNYAR